MHTRRRFVGQIASGFSLTLAYSFIGSLPLHAIPAHTTLAAWREAKNTLANGRIGVPQQLWLTDTYMAISGVDPAPFLQQRLTDSIRLACHLLNQPLPDLPTEVKHTFGSGYYQTKIGGVQIHWQAQARHGLAQTDLSSTVQVFGDAGVLTASEAGKTLQVTPFQ